MQQNEIERLQAKTPEQRLISVLQQEYHFAPKIAQALVAEAQACLVGPDLPLQPGQMRVVLLKRKAPPGRALSQSQMVEVVWTIDAGPEDQAVLANYGLCALRQVRIQRLLEEALAQGAVASQEDLARALQVSVRTIKRDWAELQAQGLYLPSRGHLQGIGRGQTHKAQIVGRWLRGETYDQIARHTHHAVSCVQRYVQTFVRVLNLHQQGFTGFLASRRQQATHLALGQAHHQTQIGGGQKHRSLRMLPAILDQADQPLLGQFAAGGPPSPTGRQLGQGLNIFRQ